MKSFKYKGYDVFKTNQSMYWSIYKDGKIVNDCMSTKTKSKAFINAI